MTQLDKAARTILKICLGIHSQESVLIVTEESLWEIGETIWKWAKKFTNCPLLTRLTSKHFNGHGLPAVVLSSFNSSDTVILLTKRMVNCKLFDEAKQKGTRFVVLQNTSKALIERSLGADYKLISNQSRKVADIFSIGQKLHLISPSGTEAQFSIARIKGYAETGLAHKAGEFTFLPAGEACVYLHPNSAEGHITLDRIAGFKKLFTKPILLNIKKGHITQIKGENAANQLRKEIRKFGREGRKVYELGVGTNDKVVLGYTAQEDEKALGTVHISFGQNRTTKVRGKIINPIKGIVLKPTLSVDSKLIVEDGNLLV